MVEKILEVCKVTPPPGSPADMCLRLTFLDLLMLRASPSELLLFYEAPHPEPFFLDSILPKLKNSLSATLGHFLPLCGNLAWSSSSSNLVICYKKGDGVLLTVAQSDADFYHLSGKDTRECRIFRPLVSRLVGSCSQVPVVAIKITLFPSQGFCVGMTTHHGVLDGNSAALFVKSWASISKSGESKDLCPELTPVFDRKSIRKLFLEYEESRIEFLKGSSQNIVAIVDVEPLQDNVRCTFELSDSDVKKLKKLVRARVAKYELPYVSTFSATHAYIILCVVKAKGLKTGRIHATFPADLRWRLKPPTSGNYFGNCIAPCSADLDVEEVLGEEGIEVIVTSIWKAIKGLDDDDGVLKLAKKWILNGSKMITDTETTNIYVAGSIKFGFQSIDFGWGIPRKADIVSIDKSKAISYTKVGDGGEGIEIELSLKKHEMERFSIAFAQGP